MARKMEGRTVTEIREPIPLIGSIAFGIIDRGTNVLQVRVTSVCGMCCKFCSVDAGPCSKSRWNEFVITDIEWLKRWVSEVVKFKGGDIEILLDGIGDPLEHPQITEIVSGLREIEGVKSIALETHGLRLSFDLVDELARSGLDRINLSIETLNPSKAKFLAGRDDYDVSKVKEVIEYTVSNTPIDVHLTPVLLPGINENDVIEILLWGKEIGVGKKWPPFTVQKYVRHKRGRKVKGVKEWDWDYFWKWIDETERKYGLKLKWSMDEWGMRYAPKLPTLYEKGSRVKVEIVSRGHIKGEWLAVPIPNRNVVITLVGVAGDIGKRVTVRIINNKDNIYLATP
ncbi:Fe-S osidoreductase [Ignicoccus islandicus DSM 13165]|uniref:Fe-S osidoreductase n=1 Tax=Ignicoccus islandicus DSM 13165 TaxID=940295 RepID=A0A0U3F2A2_9CREN|nr:radical SAM protein [Ignicoccus islandicus]ALU11685.1 Fe-S osidoreductase [Ignicoccus islandicus DSM 13165]